MQQKRESKFNERRNIIYHHSIIQNKNFIYNGTRYRQETKKIITKKNTHPQRPICRLFTKSVCKEEENNMQWTKRTIHGKERPQWPTHLFAQRKTHYWLYHLSPQRKKAHYPRSSHLSLFVAKCLEVKNQLVMKKEGLRLGLSKLYSVK